MRALMYMFGHYLMAPQITSEIICMDMEIFQLSKVKIQHFEFKRGWHHCYITLYNCLRNLNYQLEFHFYMDTFHARAINHATSAMRQQKQQNKTKIIMQYCCSQVNITLSTHAHMQTTKDYNKMACVRYLVIFVFACC